jgi:hypothetical protein
LPPPAFLPRRYGDDPGVLRDAIADESVDLVYLDPPFNSAANYVREINRERRTVKKRRRAPVDARDAPPRSFFRPWGGRPTS